MKAIILNSITNKQYKLDSPFWLGMGSIVDVSGGRDIFTEYIGGSNYEDLRGDADTLRRDFELVVEDFEKSLR